MMSATAVKHAAAARETAERAAQLAKGAADLADQAKQHRDAIAAETGGKALSDRDYRSFAQAFAIVNPASAPDDGPTGEDDLLGRYGLPSAQATYEQVLAAAQAAGDAAHQAQTHAALIGRLSP